MSKDLEARAAAYLDTQCRMGEWTTDDVAAFARQEIERERERCAAIADQSERECKAEAQRIRDEGEEYEPGDLTANQWEEQCATECRSIARLIRKGEG